MEDEESSIVSTTWNAGDATARASSPVPRTRRQSMESRPDRERRSVNPDFNDPRPRMSRKSERMDELTTVTTLHGRYYDLLRNRSTHSG
jgi:hypothetical protein